jgi:peroxiredoxin
LKNLEGHLLPDVTFHTRFEDRWKDVTTSEVFANKRVVVSSLPTI